MDRRVALITGASRGIGKATALALAEAGYDIVATARTVKEGDTHTHQVRDASGSTLPGSLEVTGTAVRQAGRDVVLQRMDLLERPSMDAAVDAALAAFGRIDVLVNNAIYQGAGLMDDFLTGDLDGMERCFQGNVMAQVYVTRRVLPHMLERGGGIVVNMTSAAGMIDPPLPLAKGGWGFAHGATKAAFHRMAGLLHVEYADRGIRAYNLEPGLVLTESAVAALGETSEIEKLGFPSAPPEVPAAVAAWICTDPEAEALAGQNIHAQPFCAKRGLLPDWPPGNTSGS